MFAVQAGGENMKYLVNAEGMKRCDQAAITELGIPAMVLMERAALAVVEELLKRRPHPGPVLVVCGSGNNGGDGFAIARLLSERGIGTDILFAGRDASMTEECRRQRAICEKCGIKNVRNFPEKEYTTIVDALFGIGLSREVTGAYAELIARINASRAYKVAVDIPSGIRADTGTPSATAVRANLTVTFAARKLGQVLYPAADFCGTVVCRQVGIPVREADTAAFALERADLKRLPVRHPWANKGTYGKVLLVAGSEGMSGAACLCAEAAYRMGSGLVRVLTPECNRAVVQSVLPEAMVSAYRDKEEAIQMLHTAFSWADVVGIGPGLGVRETAEALLEETLKEWKRALVIDADGLNLLALNPQWETLLAVREVPAVVTPHIGEMARLLKKSRSEILADRICCCRDYARANHLICAEKDARTIVSDGGRTYVNLSGNNGMATGGSGDVLTGMICGLLAGGMEPLDAAAFGVYLHGLAGDAAAKTLGVHAMLAGDLISQIGTVLWQAERGEAFEPNQTPCVNCKKQ